jgi:general stress protein 26
MAKQAAAKKSEQKEEKKLQLSRKMLAETMKDIDFCMMTTMGARGQLYSRPMSNNRNVAWDGDTWFFSYADSSQVTQLESDPNVNLGYAAPDDIIFVSLTGRGEIVDDDAKKKELWYDGLEMWFPEGPEDDKVVLIKVTTQFVHYWSKEGEGELRL